MNLDDSIKYHVKYINLFLFFLQILCEFSHYFIRVDLRYNLKLLKVVIKVLTVTKLIPYSSEAIFIFNIALSDTCIKVTPVRSSLRVRHEAN